MRASPKRELSVFDSTCIIVGIIIVAGIYETAPTIAACMGGWAGMMFIWLVGVVVAGLLAPQVSAQPVSSGSLSLGGVQLALILVLFTYGGWHEIAYVAQRSRIPSGTSYGHSLSAPSPYPCCTCS